MNGSVETMSVDDFDRQMNVNVRSVFMMTKLAVPHLKKTKGTIVNVSSVAGLRSVSYLSTSSWYLMKHLVFLQIPCFFFHPDSFCSFQIWLLME